MKVYRIKHKPSGLYLDLVSNRLTKKGSIIDWEPIMTIERPIRHTFCGIKELLWVPAKFWELKEYDLED